LAGPALRVTIASIATQPTAGAAAIMPTAFRFARRGVPMIHFVLHDPEDSVAVIVVEGVTAGTLLTGLVLDEDRTITLPCVQDIPLGHKVALKDMATGDTVIKYGADIGKVVQPIRTGQHAHVHNIKTKRW
jgi:(2R)-sulfolactate sulfo-lyase subunit alpha